MELVIVLIASLLAISFPSSLPVHPAAISIVSGETIDALDCREAMGPDSSLDAAAPSRSANFRIRGAYECHRPVFALDERDPFIERVIQSESIKAKRVAAGLIAKLRDVQQPVALSIKADEPEIQRIVGAIYRAELAGVLGVGRVSHLSGESSGSQLPVLQIEVRRLDAPDLITKAQLLTKTSAGERQWFEL